VESITTENPRAYLHYMAGLLAKEEGRAKDAIAEMEKAIGLDSTFALAYYEVSRLTYSFRPGASDQSWAYAEKARNLKSKLSTRDQMRVEAWWADTPARQIEILKEARKRWPDDRQVLIDLINRLSSWWKYHEALQVAEEGQRLYPDEPIFNGPDYSGSLIHAGRAEDALRAARSWASKHPAESDNFKAMANRFLALGMPDSAEVAFNRAIAIDPKLCPEMQGYLAYQRGELKDAIAIFENILEREDLSADERFNLTYWCAFEPCLASLYVEAGRYKRVRNLIGDQITSSFINPPIFRLFIAIRRAKEVRDMIVDNAMGPPINSYRPLGRALAMLGDAKGAREVARQYMGTENDWGTIARYDALEIRVWAALAEGDPTSALELLGQMRDLVVFPFGFIDIDYWTALGMAYRMDGRLEKAVEVHKEMLKIHGGHALSHYELGTLYEEMKRPAEAKKEYAKFLEMWSEADEDLPQLIDARKRLASL
jgi:tetratricopeptide (TPR) repeat protein